jgi:hypothetical protein
MRACQFLCICWRSLGSHPGHLVKVMVVWRRRNRPLEGDGGWSHDLLGAAKLGLPEKGRGEHLGPVVVGESVAGMSREEQRRVQGTKLVGNIKC